VNNELAKNKFFLFNQNNSGGYFIENERYGVGSDVIIEAQTASEANEKLNKIGENVVGFFDFCDCCGDRWDYCDEDDGTDEPMIYDTPVDQYEAGGLIPGEKVYIHYYFGIIKIIDLKKEKSDVRKKRNEMERIR
jgi:hypothetical protein